MENNATKNEKLFNKRMDGGLKGKKRYSKIVNEESIEISVDFHLEYAGKLYLIEIDSANEAKLLVGQYCLLNKLFYEEQYAPVDTVFVVVHFYDNYNPQRTIKNLNFVKDLFSNPIPFKAFHQEEIVDKNDFLAKISTPYVIDKANSGQ